MFVIDNIPDLRAARRELNGTVGLVATMGALHDGHLELIRQARHRCDAVIATIFVNPTQFGQHEDLSNYPRPLARDLALLESAQTDLVFTPTPAIMYPAGYQTYITVEEVTRPLEGASRPGHFRGVATVVSKLFHLTQPHQAFFGQKDAQQVVVIQQMVRDLDFPLEVVVVPTLREPDGLAMSSRNGYLTAQERAAAPVIYRALQLASQRYDAGERNPNTLREIVRNTVQANPLARIDYISAADPRTLQELDSPTEQPILLSLTVQIGKPRLLDNLLLPASLNTVDGLSQTLNG